MGRRPRAWGPPIDGLLVIDKPVGPSSAQVVACVRRAALGWRCGHAGTLDPLASGIVICCLGLATKSVEQLMGLPKIYETEIDLSAFTPTDDAEGERQVVAGAADPGPERLRQVLDSLLGEREQRPPAYSACKIGGRPAYELARAGKAVEPAAKLVRIDAIDILSYTFPLLRIQVRCGRGTYIRVLAREIGQAIGCGGYLTALRRLAVGPYDLSVARSMNDLPQPLLVEHLLPIPLPG